LEKTLWKLEYERGSKHRLQKRVAELDFLNGFSHAFAFFFGQEKDITIFRSFLPTYSTRDLNQGGGIINLVVGPIDNHLDAFDGDASL
jgi:hypothetical protein